MRRKTVTNKFAATYYINKYSDGFDGFDYELLDLQVMFQNHYEEDYTIGEYTDTYEDIKSELTDRPEGEYTVFVIGSILYSTDYYGESDSTVEVEYTSIASTPKEEDAQEILEFLDRMGSVRPEDINSNLF